MQVIEAIAERQPVLKKLRRDIHAHPELAFQEHRTAETVASYLQALGIETHRGVGKTGVVGLLRAGKSDRAIGLRADMDALPIAEGNTFEHRSRHAGCMHACGHDGHTTMLLGAAEYLAATRRFDGTVVFVFQPAEEAEGGAAAMMADGLFERFPMQAIYGMHNWPGMPVGTIGITAGPVMASTDRFDIVLRGHGAHAAMPHQGRDPLVAGAQLVGALQQIVSRATDPLDALVVSVTGFHAGEAYNAIPSYAKLRGTVRALSPAVRERAQALLERTTQGIAQAHGIEAEIEYQMGYPATVNTAAEAQMCRLAAAKVVGMDGIVWSPRPSMGAEDFAFYLEKIPGCYIWIGNGPEAGGCMLHNPHYDFNDELIPIGASYWARLAESCLVRA